MNKITEVVTEKVNIETFSQSRKDLIIRVSKKINKYLLDTKKEYTEITKDDVINIMKSIKSRSYGSLNQHLMAINDILKYIEKEDCKLETNSNDPDAKVDMSLLDMIEDESSRYYTKEQVIDICNCFINPQDKFVIYALFNGICGKACSELTKLKSSSIDIEKGIITLENRMIIMDEYMKDICSDMLNVDLGGFYHRYMKEGRENSRMSDGYNLNMSSEYAIKSRPYAKNNEGTNAMSLEGFNTRIKNLADVTECKLSPVDLVRSGIMYKMNEIKKEGWTQGDIERFLKQNNIKMRAYELKRLYELKYNSKK